MSDEVDPDRSGIDIPDDWPFPVFSATQIDTYILCNRKWGIKKIDGIKPERNRFADRGVDMHGVGERFLRHAIPPPDTDAGKVFRASIPHLPAPGSGLVEEPFLWVPKGEKFSICGKMDWVGMLPGLAAGGALALRDHKNTSSFDWAKSAEELRTNVQAVTYCAYLLEEAFPDEGLVHCRWLYDLWKPDRPKCRPVDFIMPREHVFAEFEKIKETCREMVLWLEKKPRGAEMPYQVSACDAFGGCSYRGVQCVLSDAERMRAHMAQQSLREKMAARAAQAPAVNPGASEPQPPPQQAPAQASLPTAPPPAQAAAPEPAPVAAPAASPAPEAPISLAKRMEAKKAAADAAKAATTAAPAAPIADPAQAEAKPPKAPKAAKPAATDGLQAAVVYLSKEKAEDLALGFEMVATGLKAIAKHFREAQP